MYRIEEQKVTQEFANMCESAWHYLSSQVQDGIQSWLKANLRPPFMEHLSFRLGNQLFFIRLEDVSGVAMTPASVDGLITIADECKGHACIMPMQKDTRIGWVPVLNGWGLIDAKSGESVNPIELITDELTEMTDWELQDFAVQIVRDDLIAKGYELMSWQGCPTVNPSLWFIGDSGRPEWIVVRFSKKFKTPLPKPDNWNEIAAECSNMSSMGHFASVYADIDDNEVAPDFGTVLPFYRGHLLSVSFDGLETPSMNQ